MASEGRGKALATLPSELLVHVITHIETSIILSNLSQTCRRIHEFVEHDGFRVFVQTRLAFIQPPAFHSPSFWRDAAHGLTTLNRNWNKKALIAWVVNPRAEEHQNRRKQRQYFRTGQTMGFVPVIDSYESWCGGDWSSRKEVVAWGAGAELVARFKSIGNEANDAGEATSSENSDEFKSKRQRIRWINYNEIGAVEGRDDITSINLLPQQDSENSAQVVTGRASGILSLISLSADLPHDQAKALATYETAGRSVRSAATNSSSKQILAACLSDSSITLYPLDSPHGHVASLGEVPVLPPKDSGKTWSCRFLSNNRLAAGLGPSLEPIRVYDIGCEHFKHDSALSLAIVDEDAETRLDTADRNYIRAASNATSVYSLAPLSASSGAGGVDGNVFLSGAYDGLTRCVSSSHSRCVLLTFKAFTIFAHQPP